MSIVDHQIARHEAETKALVDGLHTGITVREHAVQQISELIALARELEAHCEAMATALYRLEINADMIDESPELAKWNQFVKERGTCIR